MGRSFLTCILGRLNEHCLIKLIDYIYGTVTSLIMIYDCILSYDWHIALEALFSWTSCKAGIISNRPAGHNYVRGKPRVFSKTPSRNTFSDWVLQVVLLELEFDGHITIHHDKPWLKSLRKVFWKGRAASACQFDNRTIAPCQWCWDQKTPTLPRRLCSSCISLIDQTVTKLAFFRWSGKLFCSSLTVPSSSSSRWLLESWKRSLRLARLNNVTFLMDK